MLFVQGLTREAAGKQEERMFKLRIFRIGVALSSLAALASSVGAGHKWG